MAEEIEPGEEGTAKVLLLSSKPQQLGQSFHIAQSRCGNMCHLCVAHNPRVPWLEDDNFAGK